MAKKKVDFWIFITVFILLSLGTIMIFSSSAPYAYTNRGDMYHFFKKQLIFAPLGIASMLIFMNFDYRKLTKLAPLFLVISMVFLILVLIPKVGTTVNGATRWLFGFQPSEFAKVAIIIFFAHSISKRKGEIEKFFSGLLPYLIIIGIYAALLLKQPHLSCTIVILAVGATLLFIGGARIKHFILLAIPTIAALIGAILTAEYRLKRFLAFLDPFKDAKGDGYQVIQSLYAIGSGGLFGKGLGKSLQKFLYIPEPYNDFILAILAEELGFVGVATVIILFLILIWRGIKVAINAPDSFGSLVAVGITVLIAVQVIINIAVVTSSMPVTGMPLPFFSYGGTALIFLMSSMGILLNISRYAKYNRI